MIATGGVLRGVVATRQRHEAGGGSLRPGLHGSSERRDSQRRRARRRRRRRARRLARRRRPADAVVVRGKVQMCSVSGVVVCLGLLVLLVGITMTVMGYWPRRRVAAAGFESPGRGNASVLQQQQRWWYHHHHQQQQEEKKEQTVQEEQQQQQQLRLPARGSLATFVARHLLHSERMKLLGPLLMGVGIFVFICANAVLHENRDRETRVIHLRDIYSTVIDASVTQAKRARDDALSGYEAWLSQGPVRLADEERDGEDEGPVSRRGRAGGEDLTALCCAGDAAKATPALLRPFAQSLATTSFRSFVEPGFFLSRGGHAAGKRTRDGVGVVGVETRAECCARSIVSPSVSAFTLPIIKLNNCVIDEGVAAPVAAPSPRPASPSLVGLSVVRASAGSFLPRPPPPAADAPPRGDQSNDADNDEDEDDDEEEEMGSRDNPEDGLLHGRAEPRRAAAPGCAEPRASLAPAVAFLGKLLSPALGRRRAPPPLVAHAAPQAAWDSAGRRGSSRRKSSSDRDAACGGGGGCAASVAVSGQSKSLDLSERDAFHICSAQPQPQQLQQQQHHQQRMKHPSWPRLQERAASCGGTGSPGAAAAGGRAGGVGGGVGRAGGGLGRGGGGGVGAKAPSGYVKLQGDEAWSEEAPGALARRRAAAAIMSRSHSNYSFELEETEEPRGDTSETTF